MLTFLGSRGRLCDGLTRRETLRVGGLGLLGLALPDLARQRQASASTDAFEPGFGKAKSCIVLFLMGGPPQHSTWDPKPEAPPEVRGDFGPISTAVPGLMIGELMPQTARVTDKICVLRAMASGDNAHSSSGYFMLTGQPHQPMNFENANPGAPNDSPSLGALVRRLSGERAGLPAAITVPHRIFNTNGSVWPGQDAGFLGRQTDPWLLKFDPTAGSPRVDEYTLPDGIPPLRFESRRSLLDEVNRGLEAIERGGVAGSFDRYAQQAFDLLRSSPARHAFDLERETAPTRDRYGRTPFGNSVLLARRLVEAGVSLVQVNWYRGPDEPEDNPCWDSHTDESQRLKTVLMPPMDQAYSALLDDLDQRGLLDETLVVWMAEFGRTPKFNARAGRDHWGFVYPVALSGGGVRGGQVWGASDKMGAYPKDGQVAPHDLSATIFHCLGYSLHTEFTDRLGRPLPISRGEVIRQVF
ncbi:MAG: DUF1501 domain-containing protein [Pirellulales bacterium]